MWLNIIYTKLDSNQCSQQFAPRWYMTRGAGPESICRAFAFHWNSCAVQLADSCGLFSHLMLSKLCRFFHSLFPPSWYAVFSFNIFSGATCIFQFELVAPLLVVLASTVTMDTFLLHNHCLLGTQAHVFVVNSILGGYRDERDSTLRGVQCIFPVIICHKNQEKLLQWYGKL